jgi:hypothetical protein
LKVNVLGTMIVGDLNLHHERWLRFSTGNSAEGEMMRDICGKDNLRQLIREPTRGKNLLDLAITDIASATGTISTKIADHAVLFVRMNLSIPQSTAHRRTVWLYSKADWAGLADDIGSADWTFLDEYSTSTSAELMTKKVLTMAFDRIPQRLISCKKKSHP